MRFIQDFLSPIPRRPRLSTIPIAKSQTPSQCPLSLAYRCENLLDSITFIPTITAQPSTHNISTSTILKSLWSQIFGSVHPAIRSHESLLVFCLSRPLKAVYDFLPRFPSILFPKPTALLESCTVQYKFVMTPKNDCIYTYISQPNLHPRIAPLFDLSSHDTIPKLSKQIWKSPVSTVLSTFIRHCSFIYCSTFVFQHHSNFIPPWKTTVEKELQLIQRLISCPKPRRTTKVYRQWTLWKARQSSPIASPRTVMLQVPIPRPPPRSPLHRSQ